VRRAAWPVRWGQLPTTRFFIKKKKQKVLDYSEKNNYILDRRKEKMINTIVMLDEKMIEDVGVKFSLFSIIGTIPTGCG
jgi:hypothetical protein